MKCLVLFITQKVVTVKEMIGTQQFSLQEHNPDFTSLEPKLLLALATLRFAVNKLAAYRLAL